MEIQELLAADISQAEKARRLFSQKMSLREVANLVCRDNRGWAYNIRKKWLECKEKQKGS